MTAHTGLVCVCNEVEKEWGCVEGQQQESPEGDACMKTRTPPRLSFTATTTTKLLYFASRVVVLLILSTSTLLVDSGGRYE